MRVIILAKAPVAGRVKTRLMPIYSAKEAKALHQRMVKVTLEKVCNHFNDVWLAVDDPDHVFFKQLEQQFGFRLCTQGTGDLGKRLQYLMRVSFEQDTSSIMFLGTDSPHVAVQRYISAYKALDSFDVVVGAVEDGGYDLLATRHHTPSLFECINWGTESVFQETIAQAEALNLKVKVLEASFDLDRPEDIQRAPTSSW